MKTVLHLPQLLRRIEQTKGKLTTGCLYETVSLTLFSRVMSDEDSPEESTPIKRPVPSPAAPAVVQHQGYLPNELEQMYIQQQQQQQQHQMMAMNSFIPQQQQQTQG